MIVVHYLEDSRAHRILWLLEELGLEYEVKSYRRSRDMRAPKELKSIHPLGKSPILDDHGYVLAESGAIIDYLLDKYDVRGELRPAYGSAEFNRYRYFLHYAEGSAMTPLLLSLIFAMIPKRSPFFIRPAAQFIVRSVQQKLIEPQLKDHIEFWENELSQHNMFAGLNFTAADIVMSFPVEAAVHGIGAAQGKVAIRRYLTTIRGRDAYQRALSRGTAYRYAQG